MSENACQQNAELRQQLEQRFIHTDLEHPVIQTLFQLQLEQINEIEQQ